MEKEIKKFFEFNENKTEFILIETSIGIIEIPIKDIDKSLTKIHDVSSIKWISKLQQLYSFVSVYIENGWLFVELKDSSDGVPEYKIMRNAGLPPVGMN